MFLTELDELNWAEGHRLKSYWQGWYFDVLLCFLQVLDTSVASLLYICKTGENFTQAPFFTVMLPHPFSSLFPQSQLPHYFPAHIWVTGKDCQHLGNLWMNSVHQRNRIMGYMRVPAILQLSSRSSAFTAVQFIHVKIQNFYGCFRILAGGLQVMEEPRLDVAQLMMVLSGHIHVASFLPRICLPVVSLRNECTVHVWESQLLKGLLSTHHRRHCRLCSGLYGQLWFHQEKNLFLSQ